MVVICKECSSDIIIPRVSVRATRGQVILLHNLLCKIVHPGMKDYRQKVTHLTPMELWRGCQYNKIESVNTSLFSDAEVPLILHCLNHYQQESPVHHKMMELLQSLVQLWQLVIP